MQYLGGKGVYHLKFMHCASLKIGKEMNNEITTSYVFFHFQHLCGSHLFLKIDNCYGIFRDFQKPWLLENFRENVEFGRFRVAHDKKRKDRVPLFFKQVRLCTL